MMTDIKILKSLLSKNEVNYPKVSIDSLSSRLNLIVSSSNGVTGNGLFLVILSLIFSRHLTILIKISLDSTFSFNPLEVLHFSFQLFNFSLFHFKYNQQFLDKVIAKYQVINIDYDHQTRKFFWTHRIIYRILLILSYMPQALHDMHVFKHSWPHQSATSASTPNDALDYWLSILSTAIYYPFALSQDIILIDLAMLSQVTLHNINDKLNAVSGELQVEGNKLNNKVIKMLRWQYLLIHRLVDESSSFMNLATFGLISHYVYFVIVDFYTLAFDKQIVPIKISSMFASMGILLELCLITHSVVAIYIKSQQPLPILYKLSFKTYSFHVLNEISLFLYRIGFNDIGFSFGGLFMITPDFTSTLALVTISIIIAIPSFHSA
uniref:Gustatory receptor n=2 Tax=Tetranychus urticae TaxID=32264 RepID=T1KIC1_TETUR